MRSTLHKKYILCKIYIRKNIVMADINNFSFAQMTSNSDGKTSGSGTMGILICTVGAICFFMGCVDKMFVSKDMDVITQSIVFVGIGSALLGYRKSKESPISATATDATDTTQQLNS